jgi:formylglycine-generating enzyme required for sulfatase activity
MNLLLGLMLTFSVVSLCECMPAGASEQPLKPWQLSFFKDCETDCPEMVVIPAGSFTMGSPQAEPGHQLSEAPRHNVKFAKPFAVSKFEVTFAQWDACAAYGDCIRHVDDRGWGRGRQPVISVSWDDAQRYVAWLSKIAGKSYRLPTEAEYEYAARAGTQTAYPGETRSAAIMPIALAAAASGTAHKPLPLAPSRRTAWVSMTWSAMSGNG